MDVSYAFLYSKSGAHTDGMWWKEFVKFHHAFVTPSLRSMSGDMFEALADYAWILLGYAILKAAYLCPKGSLEGRMCVWIDPKQVKSVGRPKDQAEID